MSDDDDDSVIDGAVYGARDETPPRPVRQRPPLLQAPIYLTGGTPPAAVVRACKESAPRLASLIGATALGVTAAYFGPKFFDWALGRASEAQEPDEVELEVDDE